MNKKLNGELHALLNQTGLTEQKPSFVFQYTNERSSSSGDMTDKEATALIAWLRKQPQIVQAKKKYIEQKNSCDKMRRKIIAKAHLLGWNTAIDGSLKADMERINNWCTKFGYLKKLLNDYSFEELPELVGQFEKMYLDTLEKRR